MTDDPDPDQIAAQVRADLDAGTVVGDKVILSKSQALAIMAGGATLAGVLGLTSGRASAQSGGQFGTADNPLDADLGNYGITDTADGYEFTIEGDTFQINE